MNKVSNHHMVIFEAVLRAAIAAGERDSEKQHKEMLDEEWRHLDKDEKAIKEFCDD